MDLWTQRSVVFGITDSENEFVAWLPKRSRIKNNNTHCVCERAAVMKPKLRTQSDRQCSTCTKIVSSKLCEDLFIMCTHFFFALSALSFSCSPSFNSALALHLFHLFYCEKWLKWIRYCRRCRITRVRITCVWVCALPWCGDSSRRPSK